MLPIFRSRCFGCVDGCGVSEVSCKPSDLNHFSRGSVAETRQDGWKVRCQEFNELFTGFVCVGLCCLEYGLAVPAAAEFDLPRRCCRLVASCEGRGRYQRYGLHVGVPVCRNAIAVSQTVAILQYTVRYVICKRSFFTGYRVPLLVCKPQFRFPEKESGRRYCFGSTVPLSFIDHSNQHANTRLNSGLS